MGANMQRQAVPLIVNEAPFVGTGMEKVVAIDSGASIIAKRSGIVDQIDSRKIIIKVFCPEIFSSYDIIGLDIYILIKYSRTNQGTCINQRPTVDVGKYVKRGDVIADGFATSLGELSLGKNVLVAFMPWHGYNFEDSILLSERLVRDDVFTSIHISEYDLPVRDTRLGPEELTKRVPDINKYFLRHLDKGGIANIGSDVSMEDVLVGKITPKVASNLTPEEKLLRTVFGEIPSNFKNTSLRVSPGDHGIVVDIQIFTKRGVRKDSRTVAIENYQICKLNLDKKEETDMVFEHILLRLNSILLHQKLKFPLGDLHSFNRNSLSKLDKSFIWSLPIKNKKLQSYINSLKRIHEIYLKRIDLKYNKKVLKIQGNHNLPQGALKIIKMHVLNKAKIQSGDKMSGRHGNKGVVSKIIPIEDMPYLEDGKPIDIILNPLGVPSRMNIGQILETHLGLISVQRTRQLRLLFTQIRSRGSFCINNLRNKIKEVLSTSETNNVKLGNYINQLSKYDLLDLCKDLTRGVKYSTPAFDGIREKHIDKLFSDLNISNSGQMSLRDGKTGEPFDRKITVGYMYMLKLNHLADHKIHSRSTGPYSLVTQQPLGGKSCFGGQRFGEMECWALQAYGAAYTLQEILTVKSDDVVGRVKAYESIVRGINAFEVTLPESFKVLVKEIRSLGLNIKIIEK
jgi:DNA-directed RNA polymerase subunit beta